VKLFVETFQLLGKAAIEIANSMVNYTSIFFNFYQFPLRALTNKQTNKPFDAGGSAKVSSTD
jgi:hypothetical protein